MYIWSRENEIFPYEAYFLIFDLWSAIGRRVPEWYNSQIICICIACSSHVIQCLLISKRWLAYVSLSLIFICEVRAMSMSRCYQGDTRELDPFRFVRDFLAWGSSRKLTNARTCITRVALARVAREPLERSRDRASRRSTVMHTLASFLSTRSPRRCISWPNHNWSGLTNGSTDVINGQGKVPGKDFDKPSLLWRKNVTRECICAS